jgi:predicted NBD/HSP70 family sugar kinase/DNA-binding transcriptional ArsR family regulator
VDGHDAGRPATTGEVRRHNTERVLAEIYRREPRTLSELVRSVGLSRPTTDKALRALLVNQVVRHAGNRDTGSHPARLYGFDDRLGYLVGIDVGPHVVRVRVDTLEGPRRLATSNPARATPGGTSAPATAPLGEHTDESLSPDDHAAHRLAAVERALHVALQAAGVREEQVWAATVATPGIVGPDGAVTIARVMHRSWAGDGLITWLRDRFPPDCAVAVENDANLAALAEHALGAADTGEAVVITAGRRLGVGLVRNGAMYRGAHGQVGEVGNSATDSSWRQVNQWLIAKESDRRLFETAGRHRSSTGTRVTTGDETNDASRLAASAVGELADHLAPGLADLAFLLDPRALVLAGPLALAGDAVLEPITGHLQERLKIGTPPVVTTSPLGPWGTLLGASEHARRSIEPRLAQVATTRPEATSAMSGPAD